MSDVVGLAVCQGCNRLRLVGSPCPRCMPPAQASGIEASVCADIAARQRLGIAKYGQTVADNPATLRAWLQHAYEETLDNAVYLRRAIAQLDEPS